MKYKIAFDLPEGETLLGGLTPDLHPPFVAAKARLADAEQLVERRKRECASAERAVVAMSSRAGATALALGDAMRTRDAAVLLLEAAERNLVDVRAQLVSAEAAGWRAAQAELARRATPIRQTTAEIAPALAAIDLLEAGIAAQEQRLHFALMTATSAEIEERNRRARAVYVAVEQAKIAGAQ